MSSGKMHTLPVAVFMAVGVFAWNTPAQGQINVQQTAVEGRDTTRNDLSNVPLSQAECEANVDITFLIENIPESLGQLTFWSGGADCNTVEQRSPTGTCDQLDVGEIQIQNRKRIPDQVIPAQALFKCDTTNKPTFYVLAVNSPNDEVDTSEYGTVVLGLDATPPPAPSEVKGSSGDTQIGVTWTATTTENIYGYTVYIDSASTDCTSSLLVAGEAAPVDNPDIHTTTVNGNAVSASVNGAEIGLEYGEQAAVAVASRDISFNYSVLSTLGCITREETFGFWQQHCFQETNGTSTDCPSDGCAVTPASGRQSILNGTFVFIALAILWVWRRRLA